MKHRTMVPKDRAAENDWIYKPAIYHESNLLNGKS